jgi:hypothetical protein
LKAEHYRTDVPGRVVAGPQITKPDGQPAWPDDRRRATIITETTTLQEILMTARPDQPASPHRIPRTGSQTSEFKLAWMVPMAGALLAALLEWADKLPEWAKNPMVLVAAMASITVLAATYILSRGLAKTELRGPEQPRRIERG